MNISEIVRAERPRKGLSKYFSTKADRTLRVLPGYGEDYIGDPVFEKFAKRQSDVIHVFENAGYRIVRGGNPDFANPREIGILTRREDVNGKDSEREVIEETGAQMPRHYENLHDLLNSDGQVVVKRNESHRGEEKYLLRTKEDKVKFLAAVLVPDAVRAEIYSNPDPEAREAQIQDLFEKVTKEQFDDPMFQLERFKFTAQEFIETPGDRYTSYRIVADATGKIHTALLLYSPNKKSDIFTEKDYAELEPGYDFIFFSPSSPFRLSSSRIISNVAGGGGKINFLFDREIVDETEREILTQHGIDPDNPKLPHSLVKLARKIGRASRYDYPYVGIDFLQSGTGKDAKFYAIEANCGPSMPAENLGLDPAQYTKDEVRIIMMERVAQRFGKSRLTLRRR